ncbi:unnamed protein product [Anisakis simplex]|uniref:Secreted protein n=1 Tax=Anisakis simplex TaxID=6269 RepID=A0A0M3IYM0_ANISI|nr:unnamed protein product [Anisakis simplex]
MNVALVILICSLFVASDAYLGMSRNYIRFRRPDDVWEPPFRTILCGSVPLRVQIYADPEEVCESYLKRIRENINEER